MADKIIPTPEELRQLLHYAPETGVFTWKERARDFCGDDRIRNSWNARYAGQPAFTMSEHQGYKVSRVLTASFKAHRVAWAMHYGAWPVEFIDHINGQRDDNRIVNLRLATKSENAMNRKRQIHNTSGFKGVSWDSSCRGSKKWNAYIKVDGIKKNLGRFQCPKEAAAAYNAAAVARFGDFALLNEVPAG